MRADRRRFKAIGAYIFAGGFTLGMSSHFDVIAQLENGPFGVDTTKKNFPELPVYSDPATWPLDELKRQKPDVVYCNPPCAAWSRAGKASSEGMTHWKTDPRVECVGHCFTLLEQLRPRVWMWESVTEAYFHGQALVSRLTREAIAMGYSVTYLLIDNVRIGLPQYRKRFIFIAHDLKLTWEEPADKLITVAEALANVDPGPDPHKRTGWYANEKFLAQVLPGESVRKRWEKLNTKMKRVTYGDGKTRVEGRPGFLYRRLKADEPGRTITGGAHHLVPDENRLMSPVEAQVLCGYPTEYQFVGEPYSQIGKGVSPIMGEWLGRNIAAALRGGQLRDPKPVVTELNLLDVGLSVARGTRVLQPFLFGEGWG